MTAAIITMNQSQWKGPYPYIQYPIIGGLPQKLQHYLMTIGRGAIDLDQRGEPRFSLRRSFFHVNVTGHAVFPMIRYEARILEHSGFRELPENLGRLLWGHANAIRFIVLPARMLLHDSRMLKILLGGGEQEFVVLGAYVAQHEPDLLTLLHFDPAGLVHHLLHGDLDCAGRLVRITRLSGRVGFVMMPVIMAARRRRRHHCNHRQSDCRKTLHLTSLLENYH